MVLGVLGAIIGSFVAALVTRWPDGRSVMQGRSACDGCGRALGAIELVPLLSALFQRGQCQGCGVAISPVHWRIELTGLVIGVAAGTVAPGVVGIAGAVFGWLLLALASLDLVAFWLPDRLTILLAATGLASAALDILPPLPERLIGGLAGFGTLWLVAFGYRHLRRRDGMGGGDPKLFGAIGLWLGWQMLPAVLLIASMIGLGVVLAAHLKGRSMAANTALPFGALLAIAAYPAWLFMIGLTP